MKFGKRLAAEAARRYGEPNYFDYKAIKKAIKDDIQEQDAQGTRFQKLLVSELQKVSQFYSTNTTQLEATFQRCLDGSAMHELPELRSEVQELIKYVALNYLAVVKAIKKRNRHLQGTFGVAMNTSLHALDLLIGEVFFTSPRLANLATQAEVLAQDQKANRAEKGSTDHQQLLEEYTCPVCLDTLHNPVVLTCAHRFCWGCLVAHCTTSREQSLPLVMNQSSSAQHGHSHGSQHAEHGKDLADASKEHLHGTTGSSTAQQQGRSYRVLEQLAASTEPEAPTFYPCPVCRKPQILDVDTLQVDSYLESFINNLKAMNNVSVNGTVTVVEQVSHNNHSCTSSTCTHQHHGHAHEQHLHMTLTSQAAARQHQESEAGVVSPPRSPSPMLEPWGLLPPQTPQFKGKLCVLLDMDGTLVSSFTPKRAPRLPPTVRTHIVGVGSKLNPQGVFVVERPGLTEFLAELASFAEVIIYTAGLEDYAAPIIHAMDPQRKYISACIYREGTLRTEHYQCVKDMARLNRDLKRTVLVDDTPLAFLHQPDNGIPVLGFRGDPDDRLLMEAVLPLLQTLATEQDVTAVLQRRFDMGSWFKRHGFPVEQITAQALENAATERERHAIAAKQMHRQTRRSGSGTPVDGNAPAGSVHVLPGGNATSAVMVPTCLTPRPVPGHMPLKSTLVLADFDRTLIDFDAGERVVEQLAPELLPMLVGMESPANFIPITNTLLAEMTRRGVSRDQLLATLQNLGASEMPPGTIRMLTTAHRRKADVRILSDCNSVFISHILAGARIAGLVQDVVTNPSGFEKASGGPDGGNNPAATQKLVIRPWHGSHSRPGHCCPMCPENMCKGKEVRALQKAGTYRRIIYIGDGANDVCPALCLGPDDVLLVRSGYALEAYLRRAATGEKGTFKPHCMCKIWHSHDELHALVEALTAGR